MSRKNLQLMDEDTVTKEQFLRILLAKGVIDQCDLSPNTYKTIKTTGNSDEDRNKSLHDTSLLLHQYRHISYSVRVDLFSIASAIGSPEAAEHQEVLDVLREHLGSAIEQEFSAYEYSRIQQRSKSAAFCLQYLNIVDKALEVLRKYPGRGELYYKILYYTYISSETKSSADNRYGYDAVNQLLRRDDIFISSTGYYRNKNVAIDCIAPILWGAFSKEIIMMLMQYGANYI